MKQAKHQGALGKDCVVGVVGAGSMGRGIAQVAAVAGHQVLLFDTSKEVLSQALKTTRTDLNKLVDRGKITADEAAQRLSRLTPVDSMESLEPASLVIEAIVELLDVKRNLFGNLEEIVDSKAILATNTSSLSITELGQKLKRPERFAGMHFFNPAPILPLVEIVRGAATDPDVCDCLTLTAKAWGKSPVLCSSTPGFIVNRVARPFYGEAMRLIEQGAADAATIDALMRESGGFRMGPLELTDLIGQDVNFAVTESVFRGFFGDLRYQPSAVQKELVLAGRLGRKTGQGFYSYQEKSAPREPSSAESAPRPAKVKIVGNLGPAETLVELAADAGIHLERIDGEAGIQIGALKLALTDGRLASERAAVEGPIALFDLALDYRSAGRIGLAFADNLAESHRKQAIGFFQALGKNVSIVDDVAGLVVMRTVAMLVNEAIDAYYLSVATPEDIETAMMKGVNYPIGLLKWGERIGAARVLAVMENLSVSSPDGRYRASPLLRRQAAEKTN